MTEALYLLSPPPRKQLIEVVVQSSDSLVKRLEQSREIAKRVDAEVRVGFRVLGWWRDLKKQKKMSAFMNVTSKAIKMNNELRRLYERGDENAPDDGSLAESEVSLGDAGETEVGGPIGTGGDILEQGSGTS